MSTPAINIASAYSPAIQDYLKACFRLARANAGSAVAASQLATALDVAAPSVTSMLKRLEKLRLIHRAPAGKVMLTAKGQSIALEVIRHHRLLETFLVEELGMDWAAAHLEAEVLEHHISERLETLIDQRLAGPTRDPHGEPIPSRNGAMPSIQLPSLLELPAKGTVHIRQIRTQDPALLAYLQQHGLTPGTRIRIQEIAPFGGPLVIHIGRQIHHIGRDAAACVFGELSTKPANH